MLRALEYFLSTIFALQSNKLLNISLLKNFSLIIFAQMDNTQKISFPAQNISRTEFSYITSGKIANYGKCSAPDYTLTHNLNKVLTVSVTSDSLSVSLSVTVPPLR